jgi:hypothetical protein
MTYQEFLDKITEIMNTTNPYSTNFTKKLQNNGILCDIIEEDTDENIVVHMQTPDEINEVYLQLSEIAFDYDKGEYTYTKRDFVEPYIKEIVAYRKIIKNS